MIKKTASKLLGEIRRRLISNSGKNIVWSSVAYAANPVLQVVATPFLFHRMGAEIYGFWMLLNTLLAFSGIASFGIAAASTFFVAKYRSRGSQRDIVRIAANSFSMYGFLALAMGAALFPLSGWLVREAFHLPAEQWETARLALQWMAVGMVFRFIYSVVEAILRGYERYDIESSIGIVTSIVTALAAVGIVYMGGGLVEILAVHVAIYILSFVVLAVRCGQIMGNFRWLIPGIDMPTMREIFSIGIYSWLQGITNILFNYGDRLLIGTFVGPAGLGYYSVCAQMTQLTHGLICRAFSFLFPRITHLRESGNTDALKSLFSRGMIVTTLAGCALALVTFIFGNSILALWMGSEFSKSGTFILMVLSVSNGFMVTTILPFFLLNGAGHIKFNTILVSINGFVVSAAAVLLIPWAGVLGAAWSRLASVPTDTIGRTLAMRRVLGDTRWSAGIGQFLPVVATFAVASLVFLFKPADNLSVSYLVNGVLIYIASMGACVFVTSLVYRADFRSFLEGLMK